MIKRSLAAFAALLFAGSLAAEEYTNSVSGPITSIDANTIVMTQGKGKEKYVIRRNSASKVDAALKVGDVIKVEYYMTAVSAEAKGAAPAKKEKATKEEKPAKEPKAKKEKKEKPAPAPAPAPSPAPAKK